MRNLHLRLPIFSGGLQSSLASLSPQSPWGTHVPLAFANQEHVPSCPFGDHPQPATAIGKPTPVTLPLTMSQTPAPPTGTKWWCHSSDQETTFPRSGEEEAAVLDVKAERWEASGKTPERKPLGGLFQGLWDCQGSQKSYHPSHKGMFAQEGSYDLMSVFQEMATSAGLLDSEVHKVQDEWTGQKDLWAAHQVVKSSPKDIHYFWLVPPTESPKIMGLKGIHSPEALKWQAGLLLLKDRQNEGMVVNDLHTVHYHLDLICTLCQDVFTTGVDTVRQYAFLLWVPNHEG